MSCSSMLQNQGRRPVRNNRSLLSQCLAHKGVHSVFSCQDADFSPDGAAVRSVLREPAVRGKHAATRSSHRCFSIPARSDLQ